MPTKVDLSCCPAWHCVRRESSIRRRLECKPVAMMPSILLICPASGILDLRRTLLDRGHAGNGLRDRHAGVLLHDLLDALAAKDSVGILDQLSTSRILPLPPMNLISASVACMAAAFTSVATQNDAVVGVLVGARNSRHSIPVCQFPHTGHWKPLAPRDRSKTP